MRVYWAGGAGNPLDKADTISRQIILGAGECSFGPAPEGEGGNLFSIALAKES